MAITRPVNIQKPFADSGSKNTIPVASQIGIINGAASYTDGFPPLTMTPIAAGGIPPAGADFNGILNALSSHTAFQNAGGKYQFDAALATAIGGYPVGFVLQDNAGLNSYVNILAGNTTNFNTTPTSIGVSWIPYAGQAATQSGANIYGTDTGAANACAVAFTPAITALTDGMVLWFKAKNENTGPTTLNVNGLGAVPIVGLAHGALQSGEIIANGRCQVIWNATLNSWVLVECTGGAMQVPWRSYGVTSAIGDNSTKLATMAALLGTLGLGNAASNGYMKVPYRDATDGTLKYLIVQWGKITCPINTTVPFTFPIAFPSAVLLCTGTVLDGITGSPVYTAALEGISLTGGTAGAKVGASTFGSGVLNYIAIGK
jgi:hypothetical protein